MRTIQIRIYQKDIQRLNYLYCYELRDVDEKLARNLHISQAQLLNFLINKLESQIKGNSDVT